MKLSVIIPAYNEAKTLARVLTNILGVPLTLEKEFVVVDDGSQDETVNVLKEFDWPNLIVIRHEKNLGKGAALRSGFAKASGEVFLVHDADLEYDSNEIPKLIEPIISGRASVVYGSRFSQSLSLADAVRQHRIFHPWHLFYYMGNRFLSLITSLLYGSSVTDMETGYKIFHRDIINNIRLSADRFDFEPEVTAKILKKGIKIHEVPISYKGREYDEGKKITWRDGLAAIKVLIKYRFFD